MGQAFTSSQGVLQGVDFTLNLDDGKVGRTVGQKKLTK